jgi:hypothetical protein
MNDPAEFGDLEPVDAHAVEVIAGIESGHQDAGSSIPDRKEHHEQPSSSNHVGPGGR